MIWLGSAQRRPGQQRSTTTKPRAASPLPPGAPWWVGGAHGLVGVGVGVGLRVWVGVAVGVAGWLGDGDGLVLGDPLGPPLGTPVVPPPGPPFGRLPGTPDGAGEPPVLPCGVVGVG